MIKFLTVSILLLLVSFFVNYFSVVLIKYHEQKQCNKEKVYFRLHFKKDGESIMMKKWCKKKQKLGISYFIHIRKERESVTGGPACLSWMPGLLTPKITTQKLY